MVAHIHYVLFGGSVFGDLRRLLLLVPEDPGPEAQRGPRQAPLLAAVHRVQPDVLPHAHPGLQGMLRRIEDYPPVPDWAALNQLSTDRGLDHRASTCAVPGEHGHDLASRRTATRGRVGRATRWSGRPPRRRRRGTSTAAARSTPSGRCSTCATPTSSPSIPTPPPQEPADGRRRLRRARRAAGPRTPQAGRHQLLAAGHGPVHRLGGDVLRRPVRRLLHHPQLGHRVAARGHPAPVGLVRRRPDDHPGHLECDHAARGVGDPQERPAPAEAVAGAQPAPWASPSCAGRHWSTPS